MTLNLSEPTTYYQKDGFYWMVTDSSLVQFTDSFFNEWKPGTELYYYKRRELSQLKPIAYSLGEEVKQKLVRRIMGQADVLLAEPVASHSLAETSLFDK
jgi:hypothetical protein